MDWEHGTRYQCQMDEVNGETRVMIWHSISELEYNTVIHTQKNRAMVNLTNRVVISSATVPTLAAASPTF